MYIYYSVQKRKNDIGSVILSSSVVLLLFFCFASFQTLAQTPVKIERCSTPAPGLAWDEMFNKMLLQYKKQLDANSIASVTTYTIPIVFHIIYGTETEGVYPNLAQKLINEQVAILNADYAGVGFNTDVWPSLIFKGHPAFYDYGKDSSLPAPDNNGVTIAKTSITFAAATIGPSNKVLAEPGIDRISYTAKGWSDPASSNDIVSYVDNIKPLTIWNPRKYFNVWITDVGGSSPYLGYSTFPSGTELNGLSNGSSGGSSGVATSTTDGCWIVAFSVGNSGAANAPYNLGRTLTHESGHYLGLRHVWGDGTCLNDYCADTPPAYTANYYGQGTGNTTFTYPYHVGTCSGNGTDGEMYMNFMDYTDDQFMLLFTNDQVTRMYATLTQSPDRDSLTYYSATVCAAAIGAGIEPADNDGFTMNVFPNPSEDGQFTLFLSFEKPADATIIVSDVLGRILMTFSEKNVIHQNIQLQLGGYDKGNYFVTVRSTNGIFTRRIVIAG
jgi:hypothetical protein